VLGQVELHDHDVEPSAQRRSHCKVNGGEVLTYRDMPRKGYSALSDDGDDARPLIATAPPSQVVELWRLAWPACLRNILNCGTRTHTHRQPTSTMHPHHTPSA
jgi:hypothetical protein